MPIDESNLKKGQIVKLNALRKSVGNDLAEEVFLKWLKHLSSAKKAEMVDPTAIKLAKALAPLEKDDSFRLGNQGYTVRRARGKGASGFVVVKNHK